MSTIAPPRTERVELTALLSRLGDVPLERIRLRYPLGEATEQDLIEHERTGRLAELIDGVIVEKPTGYYESRLALLLGFFLEEYLTQNDLGIVLGEAGMVRVEGQVREPDVAFYSWSRFSGRVLPRGAVLGVPPDLSVEVLSPTNTEGEMKRKRGECFKAGTQLFWQVYPPMKTVRVYTDEDTFVTRGEDDTLDGGAVLPGFALPVRRWFDRAGTRAQ
jgi:Uma2 family endonuclease